MGWDENTLRKARAFRSNGAPPVFSYVAGFRSAARALGAAGAAIAIVLLAGGASAQTPPPGYSPPPANPAPLAPPPPMGTGPAGAPPPQAGGLQAPPPLTNVQPIPGNDIPGSTAQQLSESEHKDSGRGLEFVYASIEGGVQVVGLKTIHAKNFTADTANTSDTGAMFGAAAGLRLVFLTVGPHFRIAHTGSWDIWSLNLDAGVHMPLGNVEPHFLFGAGFTKLGNATSTGLASDDSLVKIRGYNIRMGIGIDYYVSNAFSIGADASGELLALSRPGVDPTKVPDPNQCAMMATVQAKEACAQQERYTVDGTSLGMSGTFSLTLGLHF